jgi:hypothetical protein
MIGILAWLALAPLAFLAVMWVLRTEGRLVRRRRVRREDS